VTLAVSAWRSQTVSSTSVLLLPVYFVVAGLQVDLSQTSWTDIGELALIMLLAISDKFIGAFIGTWLYRVKLLEAATFATLMNTRGPTETVIVTVGLQLNVVDRRLYSNMVVMAVLTTAMTGVLLQLIYPRHWARRDTDQALPAEARPGR
jgi:Kef-type K+ transport system membrane component KefB